MDNFEKSFVKLIPREIIEKMIAYRDGQIELTEDIISEIDNSNDFVCANKIELPGIPKGYGMSLYYKDDKEFQYPVSYIDAYCHVHYNILKEQVCKTLGIPNYVYLDLEYMLSKYFG